MNKKNIHRIKIGDRIKIISGNNKGIIGSIKGINLKTSKVFVDTVSPRTKFVKNKENGESQTLPIEIPIHISNVMLWDSKANLSSRVGYKIIEGKKIRFFRKSGNLVQ